MEKVRRSVRLDGEVALWLKEVERREGKTATWVLNYLVREEIKRRKRKAKKKVKNDLSGIEEEKGEKRDE